jgi:hypothetical protein
MTRTKTRTARAYVWLTPLEKETWNAKAAAAGMNLNEYIRCCVERRKITLVPPEINRITAVELSRIGVNLNQQVRAMNTALASGQYISNIDEALATVTEVTLAVQKLQLELIGQQA